jgi:hypothetical protein
MWVKRTPWSVLLIAVLSLGSLDWHPAGKLHDASASAGSEVYFPGAEHPDQPAHYEQADPAHRPVCPVCVLRAQTSGAHLCASASLAPPSPRARGTVELSEPLAPAALRPSGGRAPPSSIS